MKNTKGICFCLLAYVFFFMGCGPAKTIDDSLNHVPADITSVTAFNMEQLLQKADLNFIQSLEFYQDGVSNLKKDNPALASILEDPVTSGVDLTKQIYFIVDVVPNSLNDQFYGLVCSIADQPMFESMLNRIDLGAIEQGDQFHFVTKHNKLLAWNKEFALMGTGSRSFNVKKEMLRFFNCTPEQSIANNTDLRKCFSEDYDVATWMNSDFLANHEGLKKSTAMIGISNEAFQDNYIHAYLTFNEGSITANSRHYLQRELRNDLNLFFKDGIDQNVSKYIPADNLGMLLGAAMDTKGIYQVISEKIGGYAMANKVLKEFGFTIKDISNAFNGDIVMGIYDQSNGQDTTEPLIVSSINDAVIFEKFIALAKQLDLLEKQEDNLYLITDLGANFINSKSNKAAYLLVKDKLLFISENASMIQTIRKGGYRSADQVNASIYETIDSNSLGAYLDFKNFKHLTNDLEKGQDLFTHLEMNIGLKQGNLKAEMANKDMNSLKALFELMNEIYLSEHKVHANPSI